MLVQKYSTNKRVSIFVSLLHTFCFMNFSTVKQQRASFTFIDRYRILNVSPMFYQAHDKCTHTKESDGMFCRSHKAMRVL